MNRELRLFISYEFIHAFSTWVSKIFVNNKMGDEREIAASPAPSTNPSEAGSKSIEIVHYDILLSREKLEVSNF